MFSIRTIIAIALAMVVLPNESRNMVVDPPPPEQAALMARYIMHKTDWLSIATISTREPTKGYPFVSLKSVSDGPVENGTGIPYLYLTDMDVSGQDLKADNRCTIMSTLAETDYCIKKDLDPQDPICAKLIISGRVVKVANATEEYSFAHNALISRHKEMSWWPIDHGFYVAKVDIEEISVLDYFGGIKHVTLEDYLNATEEAMKLYEIERMFEDNQVAVVAVDA